MKVSYNHRYHKICALAEYQAEHFAKAVSVLRVSLFDNMKIALFRTKGANKIVVY